MKDVDSLHLTDLMVEATAPITRSQFPADALAVIYKPARSTMMSAPKRKDEWKLQFERRAPLRIEPLMGWTEDDDPLAQVELSFPSAEAAIAYARRQGLQYTVVGSPAHDSRLRLGATKDAVENPQMKDPDRQCRKLEWPGRTPQLGRMASRHSAGARINHAPLSPSKPCAGGERQLVAA